MINTSQTDMELQVEDKADTDTDMDTDMDTDTEILVHITASSRAWDDAQYRALAAAYLEFEPADPPVASRVPAIPTEDPSSGQASSSNNPAAAVTVDARTFSDLNSPDLSFTSVWDNAGSPLPGYHAQSQAQTQTRSQSEAHSQSRPQPSWVAPPSEVADSQPYNSVMLVMFTSPTRILEHTLCALEGASRSSDNDANASLGASASANVGRDDGEINVTPQGSHEKGALLCSSVNPHHSCASSSQQRRSNLPSLRDPGQASSSPPLPTGHRRRHLSSQSSALPILAVGNEADDSPLAERAESEPPAPKRRRAMPSPRRPKTSLARSSSDLTPVRCPHPSSSRLRQHAIYRHHQQTAAAASDPAGVIIDPAASVVLAPEPPISTADVDPAALLTPKLEKLAREMELPRRYGLRRQLLKGREPRPLERGFWTLDCAGWGPEMRRTAWEFVAKYVAGGDAGWGVWVKRDLAEGEGEGGGWGGGRGRYMRLFSFGFVAGHMYLMLYMASQRRILQRDCTWASGDGDVVLVRASKGPGMGPGM